MASNLTFCTGMKNPEFRFVVFLRELPLPTLPSLPRARFSHSSNPSSYYFPVIYKTLHVKILNPDFQRVRAQENRALRLFPRSFA